MLQLCGFVYRVLSLTSGRMIHLQSRGEYHLFHLLDLFGFVRELRNVREGFGVPLSLTEAIAEELGIKHPFNRFAGIQFAGPLRSVQV